LYGCDWPPMVTGTVRKQTQVSNFQFRGSPKQRPAIPGIRPTADPKV